MPPDGVAVAVPSQEPGQLSGVPPMAVVNKSGWIMTTVSASVQPLASVTVKIKLPAHKPVALEVVCTGVVFHE